jgi:hypothetical protein
MADEIVSITIVKNLTTGDLNVNMTGKDNAFIFHGIMGEAVDAYRMTAAARRQAAQAAAQASAAAPATSEIPPLKH